MPTSIGHVAPLLKAATREHTNFAAEQFELVYHQKRTALTNYAHPGAILLLRERRPWKAAGGQWAKVYVHSDGSATVLAARDGSFDDWEKRRIIAPPLAKQ